eukprot:TRINITY_DN35444_c0_g1_i2.p1 TRINITY_DN35444_c0_g1~~TRINITY_DN35444_c0_g1_i2.p1  ORF type:complete len:903 (+),score=314.39 TRINITY_DN35444_c0_g1_i2:359-2710(+)
MAQSADPKVSSARIMCEFYTGLLKLGDRPVPENLRASLDVFEKEYKEAKKAEKTRREEKERLEREAKVAEVEEAQPEPEEDEEYADDFEDEDAADPEAERANKLINEQMQREYQVAMQQRKGRAPSRGGTPKKDGVKQGILLPERQGMSHADVLENKKRSQEWTRQYERAQEILQLVPLDCITYDMMEIQPITEYELYIRNFGSSNTEQMATQVPDDTEVDATAVQTDEITSGNQCTQVPEDLGLNPHSQPEGRGRGRYRIDTAKLSSFMTNCSGVFRVLLDESTTAMEGGVDSQAYPFSTKVTTLKTSRFIGNDRGTTGCVFSRVALQYMASIHGQSRGEPPGGDASSNKAHLYDGLCLVWNISNPSTPDKFCIAGGTITTATFSPYNGHLLYGGSSNGSVYLWDLREPDFAHVQKKSDRTSAILRTPTYSTDYMSGDNHSCAIRRILPVGYNNILMGGMNDADWSEQVATLDEMGCVKIWIVVDVVDKRAFEKDFGLNVGGKLRLFRSATVQPQPTRLRFDPIPVPEKVTVREDIDPFDEVQQAKNISPMARKRRGPANTIWEDPATFPDLCAYDLEFQPDDASQFLIGSDGGYILHSSRFGDRAVPSRYRSAQRVPGDMLDSADVKYGTRVMSIHYAASTDSRLFLAGLSDGSISIYKTGWGTPVFTLDSFTDSAVIVARWSMFERGVIWALDAKGFIYVFDLIEDEPNKRNQPIIAHDCTIKTNGKVSYPNDFDFSYDAREPKLAVSYNCGRVDLHILTDSLLNGRGSSSCGDWLDSLL